MEKLLLSFLLGLGLTFLAGLVILPLLRKLRAGQQILSYVEEHKSKSGTPTMGGVIFLVGLAAACLLTLRGDASLAYLSLAVTVGYGVVGFLDDFIKVFFRRNLGLRAYQKIVLQLGVALIVGFFAYNGRLVRGEFYLPFSGVYFEMGAWTVPFVVFIFLATTNGVNLTDGMDGLAAGVTAAYMAAFAVILFISAGSLDMSGFIVQAEEYLNLSVFSAVLTGALTAYLVFNVFPAKVFMGDTGSLALGGAAACVAVLSKNSLLIPVVGLMFVVSVVSVIMQVARYKLTKKRFFLMAPYHHHLQMKGMSEPRIACVYTVITLVMGVLAVCFG